MIIVGTKCWGIKLGFSPEVVSIQYCGPDLVWTICNTGRNRVACTPSTSYRLPDCISMKCFHSWCGELIHFPMGVRNQSYCSRYSRREDHMVQSEAVRRPWAGHCSLLPQFAWRSPVLQVCRIVSLLAVTISDRVITWRYSRHLFRISIVFFGRLWVRKYSMKNTLFSVGPGGIHVREVKNG